MEEAIKYLLNASAGGVRGRMYMRGCGGVGALAGGESDNDDDSVDATACCLNDAVRDRLLVGVKDDDDDATACCLDLDVTANDDEDDDEDFILNPPEADDSGSESELVSFVRSTIAHGFLALNFAIDEPALAEGSLFLFFFFVTSFMGTREEPPDAAANRALLSFVPAVDDDDDMINLFSCYHFVLDMNE